MRHFIVVNEHPNFSAMFLTGKASMSIFANRARQFETADKAQAAVDSFYTVRSDFVLSVFPKEFTRVQEIVGGVNG